jgi:Tfp pilus assembly protein PilO
MKTAKQEVQELLEQLPDDASLEALVLEIQNRASIRRGFEELRRGEGISHEEIVKHLEESRNRAKRDL